MARWVSACCLMALAMQISVAQVRAVIDPPSPLPPPGGSRLEPFISHHAPLVITLALTCCLLRTGSSCTDQSTGQSPPSHALLVRKLCAPAPQITAAGQGHNWAATADARARQPAAA